MGNHQGSSSGPPEHPGASASAGAPGSTLEPLESYSREKQRDEHLKNLGFKRSRSLRKSLSQRLRRTKRNKKKKSEMRQEEEEEEKGEVTKRVASVERLDRRDLYPEVASAASAPNGGKRSSRPLVGEPQPLPSHVQDFESARPSSVAARKMDRLRRSLRSSLRRRKDKSADNNATVTDGGSGGGGGGRTTSGERPNPWHSDEVAVRSGTCSFPVKYLGCVEVFESRGMQVCEEAVRVLKNSKRKSVRAILYVHGDGLRVVDDDTKGLIVDQTIEKVSFCAPDRNFEKGFSYICRDGTTRRWMCHGFMAVKESGERLSHAVGCAFAICLEKKQQRDKLCTVSMTFDQSNSSFTRYGSFRQTTITERLQDPQVLKPSQDPIPVVPEENPFALARPHATDSMIQRQTSFRGFNQLQASGNSPFKRQLSLRLNELPSNLARLGGGGGMQQNSGMDNGGMEDYSQQQQQKSNNPSGGVVPVQVLKSHLSQLYQLSSGDAVESNKILLPEAFTDSKFDAIVETEEESNEDPISTMCQQLSQELFMLSHKKNDQSRYLDKVASSSQQVPLPPLMESKEEHISGDPLANVKPVKYDNPWDFVPDQPSSKVSASAATAANNNCDSSSGISSISGHSGGAGNSSSSSSGGGPATNAFSSSPVGGGCGDGEWSFRAGDSAKVGDKEEFWAHSESSGLLDDPFDAEWAALAARNNSKNVTNPFREEEASVTAAAALPGIKAFELQM